MISLNDKKKTQLKTDSNRILKDSYDYILKLINRFNLRIKKPVEGWYTNR